MKKIAEQPLMDYMLAMQQYVQRDNFEMAKVYSDMIQELLVEHAATVEVEVIAA